MVKGKRRERVGTLPQPRKITKEYPFESKIEKDSRQCHLGNITIRTLRKKLSKRREGLRIPLKSKIR